MSIPPSYKSKSLKINFTGRQNHKITKEYLAGALRFSNGLLRLPDLVSHREKRVYVVLASTGLVYFRNDLIL